MPTRSIIPFPVKDQKMIGAIKFGKGDGECWMTDEVRVTNQRYNDGDLITQI